MTPFFSIIIPLYNKEIYIKNTIQSVLSQTYNNFEILVINDGSTDNSLNIVNTIKDKRVFVFNKTNEGVSSARNYGINNATGKYLAFLDGDDIWDSSFLEHISNLIDQYPNESVFTSAIRIITPKKTYNANYNFSFKNSPVIVSDFFSASMDHPILSGSSAVIYKNIIDDIGFFNESLKTGEDTDYWIRIGLKHKVVFSIKVLVSVVISEKSLTKQNRIEYKALDFLKYEKFINTIPNLELYLNKNKFSSALKYRLSGDIKNYKNLKKELDFTKLTMKQKALITLPLGLTKMAVRFYNKFTNKKNYF